MLDVYRKVFKNSCDKHPAFLVWVVKKGWRGRLAGSRQPVHFSRQPSGWLAATGILGPSTSSKI
jgi:hypothetical protein